MMIDEVGDNKSSCERVGTAGGFMRVMLSVVVVCGIHQGEVSEAVGHLEDVEALVGRADWEAAARRIVQKAEAVGEDRTARALRGEGRGGGGR